MIKKSTILINIVNLENIKFVYAKGNKKSKLQYLYEIFLEKGNRLLRYK